MAGEGSSRRLAAEMDRHHESLNEQGMVNPVHQIRQTQRTQLPTYFICQPTTQQPTSLRNSLQQRIPTRPARQQQRLRAAIEALAATPHFLDVDLPEQEPQQPQQHHLQQQQQEPLNNQQQQGQGGRQHCS